MRGGGDGAPPAAERRARALLAHLRPSSAVAGAGAPCAQHPRLADFGAARAALAERSRKALSGIDEALARPGGPAPQRRLPRVKRKDSEEPGAFDTSKMDDITATLVYDIAKHLPGPLRTRSRAVVLEEVLRAGRMGANHLLWEEMARRYCDGGLSSNFVLPVVYVLPNRARPMLTQQIILAHPADCARIAADHVKKQPNFSGMGEGIISTTNNDHWKHQRNSLVNAFHPIASLAKVFSQTVVKRAESCAERLDTLTKDGQAVDISEFMLHETLAQLLLGLFGFPEEFMDRTNVRFRHVMNGQNADRRFVGFFMRSILQMVKDPMHTTPEEALQGAPLHGPLSRLIETTSPEGDMSSRFGNAFIFSFAGHDTTGHTLTWLIFELCRNPGIQRRLHAEIDGFFAWLGGRAMEYRDLTRLEFMTRCVMETLRLWNAVPNGTFRELQHDDWVHGEGGERVHVPKGTYVQVTTWLRHRDPNLWGPDVDVFNPDRDFRGREIWDGRGFAAFNPASERFSPFTFPPRDCIGKNFAQSEIRAILCYVLRRFTFELAHPEQAESIRGVNYGTMGPRDTSQPEFVEGKRVPIGLLVRAIPRHR